MKGLRIIPPVAEEPVGKLITTVILYDALEKDIRRAFLSIHQAVGKVLIQFPDSNIHQDVAKNRGHPSNFWVTCR